MTAALLDLDELVPGVSFPEPLHLLVPPAVTSSGQRAVELAAEAGLELDPWQAWTLDLMLRRDRAGKWAAATVGLIVPRQNGKGSILEARELAGLFLLGERRLVHTAHRFVPTARDAYDRITALIEQTPKLKQRVKAMPSGKGDQAVILKSGAKLLFLARAGAGAGRGLWGDVIILDEAYEIPDEIPQAMIPTMAARSVHGNPQLIYTSSPVNQEEHRHGRVLTRARARALAGDPGILWAEWSAGDRKDLSAAALAAMRYDRAALARANPGLGVRIDADYVERTERPNLSVLGYEVERLGVGDWPPEAEDLRWDVIREAAWSARRGAQPRPEPVPALVLGVAGSWPDAGWCSIGAAWDDDGPVVEVVDRRRGTGWVVERLEKLAADFADSLLAVAIGKSGPAADALLADLRDTDLPLLVMDTGQETAAAAEFKADVDGDAPSLRHYGQAVLDESVGSGAKHGVGDRWRWDRNGTSDAVEAVTLAHGGYSVAQPNLPAIF